MPQVLGQVGRHVPEPAHQQQHQENPSHRHRSSLPPSERGTPLPPPIFFFRGPRPPAAIPSLAPPSACRAHPYRCARHRASRSCSILMNQLPPDCCSPPPAAPRSPPLSAATHPCPPYSRSRNPRALPSPHPASALRASCARPPQPPPAAPDPGKFGPRTAPPSPRLEQ